jgi:hydrogenase expression/formation protein HypC
MCLAIPGKILSITNDDQLLRSGRVRFGGVVKEVNLAFVPEAGIDDYVIVHAGFAIGKLDEKEAMQVFEYLKEISEFGDAEVEPR